MSTINFSVPETEENLKPKITVIGVGGAGGNAVNNMIASELEGCDFVVANTDSQALSQSKAARKMQLGRKITQGLGAGARPDAGSAAAEESIEDIQAQLEGSFDTNAMIYGQQDKRPLGNGMATARADHRQRKRREATGQFGAGSYQRRSFLRTFLHFLQIVSGGENARLAGEDNNGLVLLRTIQRLIQALNNLMAQGIRLAIADGDRCNTVFQLVTCQLSHLPYLSTKN